MYELPIVKTYLDTMLSRRIPYAENRGFKEYPAWNIVLTNRASHSLHTPRTEQYSWTKGTSIDYQRYIGGKPFLKSTRIQSGSRPQVVITQSLSSYFSDKQKSKYKEAHPIESIASTLWRQYGENITIATFWGTETPQTFVDFSKIIEFLENHPYASPLRQKKVLRRYPGSLRLVPRKDG
ncbi:hypothetical protein EBR57_05010 [bacterium]|nr:hypothetical protein [bacterium]